jgi:hypothetical protein
LAGGHREVKPVSVFGRAIGHRGALGTLGQLGHLGTLGPFLEAVLAIDTSRAFRASWAFLGAALAFARGLLQTEC